MSKRNNGFTYKDGVSLKEYCDTRFLQNDKEVKLANDQLQIRLEHLNEFRASMKDQAGLFLTRAEFEAKYQLLEVKIDLVQKLVYIGIGVLLVLEIIFRFFMGVN